MPDSCFQLLYFSRAAPDLQDRDVADILETARSTNPALDITGLLLFEQNHFLQLLEGPESKVRELYDRIAADPRHSAVTTIFTRSVSDRDFGNWSMAKARIDDEEGLQAAFREVCSTGAAPEITVHRNSSAEQLLDCLKVLLQAPPIP